MYVGDEKVTVAEWNYFYNQQKMTLAQSLGKSPFEIDLKEESPFGEEMGSTWGDYLENQTRKQIQSTYIKSQEAENMGETFTEEDQEEIDNTMEMFKGSFQDEAQLRTYLEQNYGIGVTPELLAKVERNNLMARKFDENYRDTLEFTDDEVDAFYDENPDEYQVLKYHLIEVDTVPEHAASKDEFAEDGETPEEAEVEEAVEQIENAEDVEDVETAEDAETASNETAELSEDSRKEMVAEEQAEIDELLESLDALEYTKDFVSFGIKNENKINLQTAATRNPVDESDKTYFEKPASQIYPEEVRTWLMSEEREQLDKTRIDTESEAYYVLYLGKGPDTNLTANVSYRYFPLTHADNSNMTPQEMIQVDKIAEEYAETITSAEDLEEGPDALITLGYGTEEMVDVSELENEEGDEETADEAETAEDGETAEDTDAANDAADAEDAEDADDTDDTDDVTAEDTDEKDEAEDVEDTEATTTEAEEDAEADDSENSEDSEDADESDDSGEDETADDESEEPETAEVRSFGPYHDENVHSKSPLVEDVKETALHMEPGEAKSIFTYNGVYVIYVNDRGPDENWAAQVKQDLAVKTYNDNFDRWSEEDERYELKEGGLGRLFTE